MVYNLADNGDDFEKLFVTTLGNTFPNYEKLWQQFVTPLTRRSDDGNLQLREDVNELLEDMCMAHYSIYYHMGFSHTISARGEYYFEAMFFHLATATEMVDRFLFSLAKIHEKVNSGTDYIQPMDTETYHKKANEYWGSNGKDKSMAADDSEYAKQFVNYRNFGRPVALGLHNVPRVAKRFYSQTIPSAGNDEYSDWNKIAWKIRSYRNTLIHNPKLTASLKRDSEYRIPKVEFLERYQRWSDNIYKGDPNDFTSLSQLITDYQQELETRTNTLWIRIIEFLAKLSQTTQYRAMSGSDGQSDAANDDSQRPPTPPTQPHPPPPLGILKINNAASGVSSIGTGASGVNIDPRNLK